jgi:hypothetical protein
MAYWIEIRCEDRDQPYAEGYLNARCWSFDNQGCGDLASDNVSDLLAVRRHIEIRALEAGWKKLKRGWVCPHCIAKAASADTEGK